MNIFKLTILAFFIGSPVFATDYPAHQNLYVNDFANVLDDAQEGALTEALQKLRSNAGIEMTVVSINQMQDYGYYQHEYEPFVTGWFNDWGVGDKEKNNGVLILLSTKDRFARIELGDGYGRDMNARAQYVFDHEMKPLLKKSDFGEGLMAGAKGMLIEIQKPEVNAPLSLWQKIKNAPQLVFVPLITSFFAFWIASGTKIGRSLLNGLGMAFRVRKSKSCPHCQARMTRLSAFDKMQHLSLEEQNEERLGGCQYDAFKCGSCGKVETLRVKTWFSDVKSCPKCDRISLGNSEEILEKAKGRTKGTKRLTDHCGNCGYSHISTVNYSALSGGGGGFGGGSSSGGGGGGRF